MSKFIMPPDVVEQMEQVVAAGVSTYINEFTSQLFPRPFTNQAIDAILAGIARAIRAEEKRLGRPLAEALAYNLLDIAKTPKQ